MNVVVTRNFDKDARKIQNNQLKERLVEAIAKVMEASNLQEVQNCRRLQGDDRYFRIRVGS